MSPMIVEPNTLIAIFTIVLAVATAWLAVATHRLSTVTARSVALDTRPYFAFQDFQFNFYIHAADADPHKGETDLRVAFKFHNPSRVLVSYEVKSINFTFDGRTADDPKFHTHGGKVYPTDHAFFWFAVLKKVDVSTFPRKGIAQFEIEYFAVAGGPRYKTRRKIEYFVNSLKPFSCDWLYLEQHDE